jgi:hypothetical protein
MVHCECRLCSWSGDTKSGLQRHLQEHGVTRWLGDGLELHLHAAKDSSTHSENTFGLYLYDVSTEENTLVGIIVRTEERAADDPMRFEGE